MDTCSQRDRGQNLSPGRQNGQGVGQGLIAERCLVRGQNLLPESRSRAHRAA